MTVDRVERMDEPTQHVHLDRVVRQGLLQVRTTCPRAPEASQEVAGSARDVSALSFSIRRERGTAL